MSPIENCRHALHVQFCFGYGDGEVKFRVTESVIDAGYHLMLIMDEVWDEVYNEQDPTHMRRMHSCCPEGSRAELGG